jgi:hypothetical protein
LAAFAIGRSKGRDWIKGIPLSLRREAYNLTSENNVLGHLKMNSGEKRLASVLKEV